MVSSTVTRRFRLTSKGFLRQQHQSVVTPALFAASAKRFWFGQGIDAVKGHTGQRLIMVCSQATFRFFFFDPPAGLSN
jgi:hypothetical protein